MKNLISLMNSITDSSTPESKCELLIDIHAYISGASHVPRVFVFDSIEPVLATMLIEKLLLSQPLQIAHVTHSRSRDYAAKYINDINAKKSIMQDIESIVESRLGAGKIIYEESRFTPYGNSLYDEAPALISAGSPRISNAMLAKREKAKASVLHRDTRTPCNPLKHAMRTSYEQKWANSWMSPNAYMNSGDVDKTVQTIWTNRFVDE